MLYNIIDYNKVFVKLNLHLYIYIYIMQKITDMQYKYKVILGLGIGLLGFGLYCYYIKNANISSVINNIKKTIEKRLINN